MKAIARWLILVVAAALALQLFFALRIGLMNWIDPQSTTFERSEAWRLVLDRGVNARWLQRWTPYEQISDQLKRAVIVSEDDRFVDHEGVNWDAMEKAWQKNAQAQEKAKATQKPAAPGRKSAEPKIVGGSTITQQLAKNLLLSGERTLLRKGQELMLTYCLETLLSKRRILELYLNHVEWGEGVFGAQAASRRYFRKNANQLASLEAARLAVMLPRPRYFEKLPNSAYLAGRSEVIEARLHRAELP
jgi:monofunctional biosynthetic peptidoglycan transglycosylase